MFEVTVEAGFSSGHYLRNYRGKCENPHGHNYKVFVTLIGAHLDEAGLLLDFKLLKQVMRPAVDYLDHQMINDLKPFDEVNPSAENLARYFYEQTAEQMQEMTGGRVRVKDCTLYETDTSFARYYE
jgi:6-pyruvoyltetrahydropterin/6-carboxytetrahydropterin synthase